MAGAWDEAAAKALKSHAQTVAVVEATTGGLISAGLLGVSGASKYFLGSMVVYSNRGAKTQLPLRVRKQLGSPQHNYSSYTNYLHSKIVFTRVLAEYTRDTMGASWGLAESGAVEAATLPPHLRAPEEAAAAKETNKKEEAGGGGGGEKQEEGSVFTVVSLAGPNGLLLSKVFKARGLTRKEAMIHFSSQALEFLADTVQTQQPPSKL